MGNDSLTGNDSDNVIEGGAGADTLVGGGGIDTLSYEHDTAGVLINLESTTPSNGDAGGDTITGFENVVGGSGNDDLMGNSGDNAIAGGAGADVIRASGGTDTLSGGDGNETDILSFFSAPAAVVVNLSLLTAQNTIGFGTVTISGFEYLNGSIHNDTLTGSALSERIDGSFGNDVVEGGAGGDLLIGDAANDGSLGIDTASYAHSSAGVTVSLAMGIGSGGDAQNDVLFGFENLLGSAFADTLVGDANGNLLTGGAGADTLTGGVGNDVFFYVSLGDAGDHITDFVSGADQIGLDLPVGDPVILVTGSDPVAGGVANSFLYDTDDGKLYFDLDGSGQGVILFLTLDGALALAASDFFVV